MEAALGNRGTSVQEVETNKEYDDRRDWRGFLRGSLKPGSHGVNLRLSCLSAPKTLMLDTIDTV